MTLTRGASTSAEDRQADAANDIARRLRRIESVGHRHTDGPYLPLTGGTVGGGNVFFQTVTAAGRAIAITQPVADPTSPAILQFTNWPVSAQRGAIRADNSGFMYVDSSGGREYFTGIQLGNSSVYGGYAGVHHRSTGQYLMMTDGTHNLISTPAAGGQVSLRAGVNGAYKLDINSNGSHSMIGNLAMNGYEITGPNVIRTSNPGIRFGGADVGWSQNGDNLWNRASGPGYVWAPARIGTGGLSVNAGGDITAGYNSDLRGITRTERIDINGTTNSYGAINGYNNSQIMTQRNQSASSAGWYDAAFYNDASAGAASNPRTASVSLHPGGVANQIRVSQNDGYVYFRDAGGNNAVPLSASAFTVSSSRKTKKNIATWPAESVGAAGEDPLDMIGKLRVVTFDHLDETMIELPTGRRLEAYKRLATHLAATGRPEYELPGHVCDGSDLCAGTADHPCGRTLNYRKGSLGLVAEEVAEVFPAAVALDMDGNPMGINYESIVAGLIRTTQRLAARVEQLELAAS